MPRVRVLDPGGLHYEVCTRQTETLLKAWFDEVLPHCWIAGRPGIDDFEVIWPKVNVWPMWAWKPGTPTCPDWLTDSRVLGRWEELRAKDGQGGLEELLRIRREAEAELRGLP